MAIGFRWRRNWKYLVIFEKIKMKVIFRMVGKTQFPYLEEGIGLYEKRLKRYLPIELEVLSDIKNAGKMEPEQLVQKEGELMLSRLKPDDGLILLDEKGKHLSSREFSVFLDQNLQMPYKNLIFQVGGAFGFSKEVYARANEKLSLSSLTFSHQMVRLFFLEQLYRAMTILKNEPYHND